MVLLKENRHRSCYLGIQNFEELEVQGLVPISSQSCGQKLKKRKSLEGEATPLKFSAMTRGKQTYTLGNNFAFLAVKKK